MYDPHALIIHTDGSAFDNPGKRCGWGMVIHFPDSFGVEDVEYSVSIEGSTVNRMELSAVIAAISYAKDKCRELGITRVIVLSDSAYVVDNSRNAQYWRQNKWCNRDGRPVENDDLWKKFLSVFSNAGVRVEITKVAGKTTEATKRVDKLAKNGARGIIRKRDFGFVSGKISKPSTSLGVALMYDKGEGGIIIKVYGYKTLTRDNKDFQRVVFELAKADGTVVENAKFFAYYIPEDEIEISRHGLYLAHFDGNKGFPLFKVIEKIKKDDV
ncbi:MAG: RNase H family protein [Minisyncoccota bacterium]